MFAAGALLVAPLATKAQQAGKVYRIGFLGPASASARGSIKRAEALRAGLRELGYIEGKNLSIEWRWAEDNYERLPALAAELVGLKVDVIVTHGTPGTQAAKKATRMIPIVMAIVGDAVLTGLVANIARPEGNITGSTFFNPEVAAKRLQLMKDIVPRMKRAAALINPDNPAMKPVLQALENAASVLKLELQPFAVRAPGEFEGAFSEMLKRHVDAVVVVEDAMLNANADRISDIALKKGLPVSGLPDLAVAGALMAYGVDQPPIFRRAAVFIDKILKGAKPGDLPVERATKFELIVNLKTAKALGITIPQSVLLRADEVIQ